MAFVTHKIGSHFPIFSDTLCSSQLEREFNAMTARFTVFLLHLYYCCFYGCFASLYPCADGMLVTDT